MGKRRELEEPKWFWERTTNLKDPEFMILTLTKKTALIKVMWSRHSEQQNRINSTEMETNIVN